MSRFTFRPAPAPETLSATRAFSRRGTIARLAAAFVTAGAMAVLAAPAAAQDTREEQNAAERADKAARLRPFEPSALERRIQSFEGLMNSSKPVYVAMGSSFDGAGLAVGPGYRARFGDDGRIDAKATVSFRNYKSADAKLATPTFADGRVALDVHGNWLDAARVSYFGVGNDTTKDTRDDFEYRQTSAGVGATVMMTKKIRFGASLDAVDTEARSLSVANAIEPTYRKTSFGVAFDSRTSPDYTRRGSLLRMDVADYHQTNAGHYSFRRIDAEAQQFVPLMNENWVLAFRGLVSTTDASEGSDVPYFLMPELGGSRTLRGFSSWRFRDRNRLLLTGEYRWMASPLIDMAVFVDAGKVAPRAGDLNLKNLSFSQGIGIRLHTPAATLTRLEVARSREGTSLIVSFSPSF